MRWPAGVVVGARVIAATSMGFWLRGVVRGLDATSARVDFQRTDGGTWLPSLRGFGAPVEAVTPERIAELPVVEPIVLPPEGAPVIVLWNRKRFHPAILVRRIHASAGVVRYDEGDEEPVTPGEVLVRGAPDERAVRRLREGGFVPGAPVRVVSTGHAGWVSELGSDCVYVRYPKASHGHWYPPRDLALGGSARPLRPNDERANVGDALPGARVSARWVDRVRYPGTIRATRAGGAELELVWDDGSVEWVPSCRAIVTAPAPAEVPQASSTEAIDVRRWAAGAPVLARLEGGDWVRGRVEAVRGFDVFVVREGGNRKGAWARGKDLAAPPLEGRFPARGTAVVVEERGRGGRVVHRTGRIRLAIGGRAEVRLDEGGSMMAAPEALWRRAPRPSEPTALPVGLPEGTVGLSEGGAVLVEHLPDDRIRGRIVKLRAPEGLARVALESGRAMTVDLARIHPAPEPAPPPPAEPPAPPPVIEPAPPPSADERARRLARLVALEWSGGGYRALAGEGGRTTLEVEVGELTLDVRVEAEIFVVEVVAAGAVPGAPPIEGAAVRLARFFRGLLGGRAEDTDAIEAADRAWALAVAERGVRREVARAGGALSLVLRTDEEPSVSDVIGWARAVHARLFDPRDPE